MIFQRVGRAARRERQESVGPAYTPHTPIGGAILDGRDLNNCRALNLVFDGSVFDNSPIAQQIPLRRFGQSLQAQF